MTLIKCVTLDITNTIIKVLGSVGQQYANIASLYGVKADAEKLNETFKTSWKKQNLEYPNFGSGTGMKANVWWNMLVRQCFLGAGHLDSKDLLKISSHLYSHFQTAEGWEILPETHDTLHTLKSKGIKLGVISNFDERLEIILEKLDLLQSFDFILGSQLEGFAKPDIRIFEKAIKLSGECASDILHVGDSIAHDYIAPRLIGMNSLLFWNDMNNIPDSVDKKCVICRISEVLKYI